MKSGLCFPTCTTSFLLLFFGTPFCKADCVPPGDFIPPEQRVNVTAKGVSMPLGIIQFPWASGYIESNIYNIIAEEALGLHTRLGIFQNQGGFYAVAGCICDRSCLDPVCDTNVSSPWHIAIGHWQRQDIQLSLQRTHPTKFPEKLGGIGYAGLEGLWLRNDVLVEAWNELQLPLEFYRAYNTTANTSSVFSSIADIPSKRLRPCNETRLWFSVMWESYLEHTGDVAGVVNGSAGLHAACHGGHWWLSPACRQNPQKCIPWITGGDGGNMKHVAMKAFYYGMPLALGVASNWADYVSLPHEHQMTFFWWYPDSTFATLQPSEIIFPLHNKLEWANGIERTAVKDIPIEKWAYNELDMLDAYRAIETAKRYELTIQQIAELTVDFVNLTTIMSEPDAGYEIACRWVRQNRAIWETWIPLDSQCSLGQGMIDRASNTFLSAREDAATCQWCSMGRYSDPLDDEVGTTHRCVPCTAGMEQRLSGQSSCTACLPGFFKNDTGDALCQECAAGTATNLTGQTACRPCSPGSMASYSQQQQCQLCGLGFAASQAGSESCTLCSEGMFTDALGQVNCSMCDEIIAGSTSARGSSKASDCHCPVGTYMKPSVGCVQCSKGATEGLVCPGGNDEPLQHAGYWVDTLDEHSRRERQYEIYKCRRPSECPAGSLGTCAHGRAGKACNNCENYHFEVSNGTCKPCSTGSAAPFLACTVALMAIFVALLSCTRMDASKQHLSIITVFLISGQMFTSIQVLTAIAQIRVSWPEPLAGLLNVLNLFVFNLDVLRTPCVFSSDAPIVEILVKLLAYPFLLVVLLVVVQLSKFCGRPVDMMAISNINGILLFIAYMSTALAVLLPFQCQRNPSGFISMATNPGLRCYDDPEHVTIVVMAAVGIIVYPVGISAWVTYATVTFKARVRSVKGMLYLKRYRFLFARFRPECYYFGVILLARNTLVIVLPVVLVRNPVILVLAMSLLLLTGVILQTCFMPWRTKTANRTDMVLGAMLVTVVTGVAILLGSEDDDSQSLISVSLVFGIIAVFVLLLVVMLQVVRCVNKSFGIFLCHHKAGAGALCRLLKILLASCTPTCVFLDSDHLEDLDLLFNTVRTDVQSFVVVLSQEVLRRPWCAGEIVTAHRNAIRIVPLICEDFSAPSAIQITAITSEWTEEQLSTLLGYDITLNMVVDAYNHVTSLDGVQLHRFDSLPKKEVVLEELVRMCDVSSFGMRRSGSSRRADKSVEVVIAGVTGDAEKLAACEIVQMKLQAVMEADVVVVRDGQEAGNVAEGVKVVIVLLSQGILQDPGFACVLMALFPDPPTEGPAFLTVVADSSFQFPASSFYAEVEQQGLGLPGLGPQEGAFLSQVYFDMLSVLSKPFTPHGSEHIIHAQILELHERTKRLLASMVNKSSSCPSKRSTDSRRSRWNLMTSKSLGSSSQAFGRVYLAAEMALDRI